MTAKPIPMRVLVVDDDAMSRELLCVLLEAEGYAVESADSGDAALAVLGRDDAAPDLVLTDVQMPGITGVRLAGRLRRACGKSALLLAMSGSQPAEKTISRFDGFLLKPFKVEEIAAIWAARNPSTTTAKTSPKHEKRVVVRGPDSAAPPAKKRVAIDALAPRATSNKDMSHMGHDVPSGKTDPTGPPVLNEKIYQQLAGSMPGQQLREMYNMCVNDARARIAHMRKLADAHDSAKFVREAHAIKGGCGMLGATELHGMAAKLEENGLAPASGKGEPEVNSLDELTAACDRLERMLGSRV